MQKTDTLFFNRLFQASKQLNEAGFLKKWRQTRKAEDLSSGEPRMGCWGLGCSRGETDVMYRAQLREADH